MNNPEIFKVFPEGVLRFKFEEFKTFNDQLTEYIYNLQKEDINGVTKSNKGGWHSKNFILKDKNSIQFKFSMKLQKYILSAFQNYGWRTEKIDIRIKEMWAIINKKDDFNVVHTHPNCYLSSAYYVRAPENCGKFLIENPNSAKNYFFPEIVKRNELNTHITGFDVSEGDLLIFPGYLPHKVAKNDSDKDSIVISFNVDIINS